MNWIARLTVEWGPTFSTAIWARFFKPVNSSKYFCDDIQMPNNQYEEKNQQYEIKM